MKPMMKKKGEKKASFKTIFAELFFLQMFREM